MQRTARKKYVERILIATVAVSALPMIFAGPSASAEPDTPDSPAASTTPDTPSPSTTPDTPSDTPSDAPSQDQWQGLDKIVAEHSALGVFGLSDTVLMLPAGTSAEEVAQTQAEIPAGVAVTVKISKFTKGEADEVQKYAMSGDWNSSGEQLGIVAAYDGQKDAVHVAVEGPQSAADGLRQQYGDKVDIGPGRMTPEWGRFDDSVPFWGGGSIKNAATGSYCTAVMPSGTTRPTSPRLVTAGHCNTLWGQFQTASGKYFGNVERRRTDLDAELISSPNASYSGNIWTGGTADSHTYLKVTNWSGWTYLGRQLCVSGQTTFNHCGHPVSVNGVAINYEVFGERNRINGEAAYMMDRGGTDRCHCNGKFTAPGDSGAPVYELGWDPNTPDHKAAVLTGHHHGSFWFNGYDRMVNVKPGQVLQGWNLRPMYGSS
ncbi:hypothetical protein ABZ345_35240 [Lentzea sp. NPDC005914]|uniref:hypothetical protein n=1 Tax=Lentzea sp. NPDC005914 TaxID=3154572 RepID=UPI0033E4EE87